MEYDENKSASPEAATITCFLYSISGTVYQDMGVWPGCKKVSLADSWSFSDILRI